MSHFKRRHGGRQCAMTAGEDNDTSVQPQPRRNAGSRNEGGSGRTPEEPAAHEKEAATLRLIVSWDPGRRGQNGSCKKPECRMMMHFKYEDLNSAFPASTYTVHHAGIIREMGELNLIKGVPCSALSYPDEPSDECVPFSFLRRRPIKMTPISTNPDFTFNQNDDLSPMIDSILTAPGVVKAYAENRETDWVILIGNREMEEGIRQLPPVEQKIIKLYFLDGKSLLDIANELGLPVELLVGHMKSMKVRLSLYV